MSTDTNKAIVRRIVQQMWNEQRHDLIEEFFSENVIEHIIGTPSTTGLDSIKDGLAISLKAFPDLQLRIDDEFAEGDKVVLRWTLRGTHQGELMGIPATGKKVTHSGFGVYRMDNAKVAELWFLADNMGLMQQLGVIPTQGAV